MKNSPLAGARFEDVALADGKVISRHEADREVSIADAMRHGAVDRIEKEKTNSFQEDTSHARNTHSAVFVEEKGAEQLGVIRVTLVFSAIAAGRFLITQTAHSQVMGSVMGVIGMSQHYETLYDLRLRCI